mmetsp:Transcript_42031/g.105678  ORF Transcript_42031/g.105678 Transcript_42031/m.105678 type:complete len:479 (-) Transcript_42031:106-1542(-)
MGVFGKLGCGCRQRSADGAGAGEVGQPQAREGGFAADEREEAKRYFEDPLMGAQSEADAETAAELKEQGNDKFKKQQYEEALQLYNEAAQLRPRDPSLWLNRSIVNRHLENWDDGEQDAEIAIELQPSNAKAHYSRALCFQKLGKLQKALASCRAGLAAQSENKALQQLKNVVKRSIAEQDLLKERFVGEIAEVKTDSDKTSKQQEGAADEEGEKTSPRRRRKVVHQENKEEMSIQSHIVADEASCPATRIKDNDMKEIKDRANITMFRWSGENPSWEEREMLKKQLTDAFRGKYAELTISKENAAKSKSKLQTDQYDKEQKMGLQLKGGHQPMERPEHVDLPADYKQLLGIITLEELSKYNSDNPERRYLISVYGNIFDVSDRPDKYGPDGPYTILVGADITWGLFAGVDTEDYVNRCYDLFKARDMGTDKIAGVCSWLAWYWNEYGDPVGQLEPYTRESELPPPPLQEVDEACSVM